MRVMVTRKKVTAISPQRRVSPPGRTVLARMLHGENGGKGPIAPEGSQAFGIVDRERRVGEGDVEGCRIEAGAIRRASPLLDRRPIAPASSAAMFVAKRPERWRVHFDERGMRRAARQRLQPQRAAAGKEIEHPGAWQFVGPGSGAMPRAPARPSVAPARSLGTASRRPARYRSRSGSCAARRRERDQPGLQGTCDLARHFAPAGRRRPRAPEATIPGRPSRRRWRPAAGARPCSVALRCLPAERPHVAQIGICARRRPAPGCPCRMARDCGTSARVPA